MTTLLVSALALCAFSSVPMALSTLVDFSNKDLKLGKGKKRSDNDEVESFREEVGRKRKLH